ncbi:MAG: hypothetical protein HYX35_06120 [Proteobacteria bacterium]|nr:hypothetical protein [Pseudomonadota bacterium]
MSKLLLFVLVTFVFIDPVLSSNTVSSHVIDVRGGVVGGHGMGVHDRFYTPYSTPPDIDPWNIQ